MLKNLPENCQATWGSSTDVAFVCETRCSIMGDFVYLLEFCVYGWAINPNVQIRKMN